MEPSKGWEEKLDEHIINIQPTLSGRNMAIVNNYPIDRRNDEKVHTFMIIYKYKLRFLLFH